MSHDKEDKKEGGIFNTFDMENFFDKESLVDCTVLKSEQITKIYSYSCTVCFMLRQSSATDTEFWLGGGKLESCASN